MTNTKRGPGRPPGSKNTNSNGKTKSKGGVKAKAKAQEIQARKKADRRVIDEIWAIISIAVGVFLMLAMTTDVVGLVGEKIGLGLKGVLGMMAYVLPFYLIIFGILLFGRKTTHFSLKTLLLLLVILIMMATMNSIRFIDEKQMILSWKIMKGFFATGQKLQSGGFIGMILSTLLIKWIGKAGCWIFSLAVTGVCLLLLINTPVSRFFEKIGDKIEEKKIIKENAHLDFESDSETGTQMEMPPFTNRSATPKRDIKIVNSSILDNSQQIVPETKTQPGTSIVSTQFDEQTKVSPVDEFKTQTTEHEKPKRRFFLPPSKAVEQKHDKPEEKSSVLKYMNDESLFDRSNQGQYGIEDARHSEAGFGIDGGEGAVLTSAFTTGLDGFSDGKKKVESDIDEKPVAQTKLSNKEAREAVLKPGEINLNQVPKKYKKPPISLLEKSIGGSRTSSSVLQAKAQKLENTLRNFHVDAKVVQVTQGPTVTRYEIQPSVGVKVSSIVRLADDIALNLEAKSIRIEAPIPGKPAVGIEVENDSVTMVRLREIIDSDEFKTSKSKITFAVGKDIGGKAIVADLKSMPHLLIAGSTGSGKSVCINSIITSFMYKANPDEVKLILIDPKVVELGNYNGIPHLMIPVVTDPSKAAAALNWAVAEMTDRYKKFAEEGVRDLESYNEFVRANEEDDKVLPQVVIIIDELADLMMAAPSQIEESICRLAQMARAAGMHLIVATQRPSVDVITGVIKANIPSRIAFAVSSQVDSRTILDMQGAEKLVGKGDMLFNPMGMGKPLRVQGTFVSDAEVHKVIEHVKEQTAGTEYNEDILTRIERTTTQESSSDGDDLLPEAIELVVKSGQASVSMLQRRFRIGYNRAARIVDMMEARGIVGPQDGSRPRQVLMTEAELEAMENDTGEI